MRFIFLLFFLLSAASGLAQQQQNCRDVVYLRNGSVLRGQITAYQVDGELVMTTWSGAQLRLPSSTVKKIIQECPHERNRRLPLSQRPYSFRESGWYHASRAIVVVGQSGVGLGLQHSSGVKINRWLGLGVGVGIENFTPADNDVTTYPLFGEMRGYFSASNISPFYALAAGWGFADQKSNQSPFGGFMNEWRGGWMTQGQLGYRAGNHFTVHVGLRLQHKTRTWENPWRGGKGVDKILQKRLEIGIGILL